MILGEPVWTIPVAACKCLAARGFAHYRNCPPPPLLLLVRGESC